MLKKCFLPLVLAGCTTARADVMQLKDNGEVSGKIVADKRDQIAIDIGYTVLVIPRNQVVNISKNDAPATSVKAPASPKNTPPADAKAVAAGRSGFYTANPKAAPERTVR